MNAQTLQLGLNELEVRFAFGAEGYGVGVFWKSSRAALASCMDQLGRENTAREVSPDDAVVMARPTGVEPVVPKQLTPRLRPHGQTQIKLLQELPEGAENGFQGSS